MQTRFWLFLSQIRVYLPTMSILTKNATTGLAEPDERVADRRHKATPFQSLGFTVGVDGGHLHPLGDLRRSSVLAQSEVSNAGLREYGPARFPWRICPGPGDWHAVEGSDSQLDPEIARTAGSSDHIIRTYEDKKTGEQVTALVLYGLANSVFAHIPEVCYPASGFRQTARRRSINGSPSPAQRPPSNIVRRVSPGARAKSVNPKRQRFSYTFRHNGEWLPEVASRWKSFRYHPAIFKIQLQRRSSGLGIRTV